jgi:hypothetical protein
MMPPYTYASGRLAEERRRDAIRREEQARLMEAASPVRRGLMQRLMGRSEERSERRDDAIRSRARVGGLAGRPQATRSQGSDRPEVVRSLTREAG